MQQSKHLLTLLVLCQLCHSIATIAVSSSSVVDDPAESSPPNTDASDTTKAEGYRIAIIGGGISGTFAAKYLAEYDVNHVLEREKGEREGCLLDEIVVYDVSPPPSGFSNVSASTNTTLSSSDPRPPNWQGSRVSSITLKDGSVIELGASIIYSGNQLVVEMMKGDPERLVKGKPLGTGKRNNAKNANLEQKDKKEENSKSNPSGFGIYHGQKQWLVKPSSLFQNKYYPSFLKSMLQPLYFLWRYNIDFFRLRHAVQRAIHSFHTIYAFLDDTHHDVTFFESPMDMWEAMGLRSISTISFHDFLDGLGLSRDESLEFEYSSNDGRIVHRKSGGWWSWGNWRKWMPGMGCLRSELVTAMTLNSYNQNLNQMNGEQRNEGVT